MNTVSAIFRLNFELLGLAIVEIGLLLIYALCVLSSVVVIRSRAARLHELQEEGFFSTKLALRIVAKPDRYLLSVQIGAFLCAIFAGFILEELARPFFVHPSLGLDAGFDFFLGLVLVLLVTMLGIFAVQFSKILAFSRAEEVLCFVSPWLALTSIIFWPFTAIFTKLFTKFAKRYGLKFPIEKELALSVEEISEIVEMSSKAGEIKEGERKLLQGVFTFSDTVVRELMTPRKDVICVHELASLEELVQVFVSEGISRVLVTGKDLDDVKGILIAKDILPLIGKSAHSFELKNFMRSAYFVSASKRVDEILKELRGKGVHLAVVMDEHGGVDGIITIEDLVEEIVGDIFDEHDRPGDEQDILSTQAGELLVDGSMTVHDLNVSHKFNLPEGEYDTVAGLVIHLFGNIPETGESVEFGGFRFKVEEIDQNRLTKLRIYFKKPLNEISSEISSEITSEIKDIAPTRSNPSSITEEKEPIISARPLRAGISGTR